MSDDTMIKAKFRPSFFRPLIIIFYYTF